MSAPPLPEIFGNYTLGDFVEVVSPAAISWLPQTAGWLWLGAALLVLSLRYGWRQLRRWYQDRYRREAASRLQQLADSCHPDTLLVELNRLLKLTAMAAFSRERVASLSGPAWVDFLNSQCTAAPFSPQQAQLLALGIYSNATLEENTRLQLLSASQTWVREHRSAHHV